MVRPNTAFVGSQVRILGCHAYHFQVVDTRPMRNLSLVCYSSNLPTSIVRVVLQDDQGSIKDVIVNAQSDFCSDTMRMCAFLVSLLLFWQHART